MGAMAENETLGIAARLAQLHEQFKEVIEIVQIPPESRPVFTASTLTSFEKALSQSTENLNSYSQQLTENISTIDELKQWEQRLAQRESSINKRESSIIEREKLLTERTIAVDKRDIKINRLIENAQTELEKVSEARTTLDERKEIVIAAEGRQAADEQALERWHEFLREKHNDIIALNETTNQVRMAFLKEHNKAVEKLNKDMQTARETFASIQGYKETLLNMYLNAKNMVKDAEKAKASVVEEYELMMKRIEDQKRAISRMQIQAGLFETTFSSDVRKVDSLSNKVEKLSNDLENVGDVLREEEARFDNALRKIGQVTDASDNLDDLTKKLEAFELSASGQKSRIELGVSSSQLEAHIASHDMGSSPEKARPAKRQRYSRRAVSVGPSEMLSSDLARPEQLPADILDPFISSRPQPEQALSLATQTGETSSTINVQSSSPGTLIPSSQAARPTSSSGTNPRGLADASNFIKEIWSQIEFPRDWQVQDSKALLEKFVKFEEKELHWRPDGAMNRGAKWNMEGDKKICLIREFSKKKASFPDGNEKRCDECQKRGGPCINVLWVSESEGVEGEKKWLLVKRK